MLGLYGIVLSGLVSGVWLDLENNLGSFEKMGTGKFAKFIRSKQNSIIVNEVGVAELVSVGNTKIIFLV